MNACPNCNAAKGSKPTTQCDGCKADVHLACVGMSSADDARITRNKSKSVKILCNGCSKNLDRFDELKTLILSLKDDFNGKFVALNNKIANISVTPRTQEEIIVEATERVRRSQNIILSGVPETPEASNGPPNDARIVGEILSIVNRNSAFDHNPLHIQRLGKPSDKPRLIKVVLSNSHVAKNILKSKNALAGTRFKNVRIQDDKTPKQIEFLNTVRTELKERLDAGETDLTIKYKNGIPTIIEAGIKN